MSHGTPNCLQLRRARATPDETCPHCPYGQVKLLLLYFPNLGVGSLHDKHAEKNADLILQSVHLVPADYSIWIVGAHLLSLRRRPLITARWPRDPVRPRGPPLPQLRVSRRAENVVPPEHGDRGDSNPVGDRAVHDGRSCARQRGCVEKTAPGVCRRSSSETRLGCPRQVLRQESGGERSFRGWGCCLWLVLVWGGRV